MVSPRNLVAGGLAYNFIKVTTASTIPYGGLAIYIISSQAPLLGRNAIRKHIVYPTHWSGSQEAILIYQIIMGETPYYLLEKMERSPGRHEGPSLLSVIKRWSHFVITTIKLTLIGGFFLKSFCCLSFILYIVNGFKPNVNNKIPKKFIVIQFIDLFSRKEHKIHWSLIYFMTPIMTT